MPIVHIVLFQFKATAEHQDIVDACNRMLDLKQKCIHPTSKQNYIKSSSGGKNDSPEGHAKGMTHGFVVEFDNDDDRTYYLEKDPAHLAFIQSVGELVTNVTVVDYVPGLF